MKERERIAVSLRIDNPQIALAFAELLESSDAFRVAAVDEPAELVISLSRPNAMPSILTAREREVVSLLAEGLSNKEIAQRLGISVDTAKFHVGHVIDKLDATGRTDAVAHAARRGVIHL